MEKIFKVARNLSIVALVVLYLIRLIKTNQLMPYDFVLWIIILQLEEIINKINK